MLLYKSTLCALGILLLYIICMKTTYCFGGNDWLAYILPYAHLIRELDLGSTKVGILADLEQICLLKVI